MKMYSRSKHFKWLGFAAPYVLCYGNEVCRLRTNVIDNLVYTKL